eukprot:1194844-Prorocentrum_minimum.AAC.13
MCGRCTVLAAAAYTDNIDTAARTDPSGRRFVRRSESTCRGRVRARGCRQASVSVARRARRSAVNRGECLCLLHGARGVTYLKAQVRRGLEVDPDDARRGVQALVLRGRPLQLLLQLLPQGPHEVLPHQPEVAVQQGRLRVVQQRRARPARQVRRLLRGGRVRRQA